MKIQHLRSLMFSLCVMTMPLMCSSAEFVGVPAHADPMVPEAPSPDPEIDLQPMKLVISPSRPKTTHLADRF